MPNRRCISDPTGDIQRELEQSLATATRLVERLTCIGLSHREKQWLESELKKSLRAIYWSVDDYEHTLSVLSLNPSTECLLSPEDQLVRRRLLVSAKAFADDVRTNVLGIPLPPSEHTLRVHRSVTAMASSSGSYRYSLLNDQEEDETAASSGAGSGRFEDILMKQEQIVREQDGDLELVGRSVGTLKHMSYRIGDELDQQAVMLDDLGQDMERVDTKLDGVMKKMAKLAHLDDDKRQCKVIMILSCILFFLVFILIVL